ncbi:MAG: OmpA/MotB family protein [Lachnospiraceae bacterium]
MKKRLSRGDEGSNWMDTYGDLVTLLLTFFVMLYSMSNLNEQKWEVFVRSIFPNGADVETAEQVVLNQMIGDGSGLLEGSSDLPELLDAGAQTDIGTLYLTLAAEMNARGIDGVSISRGKDYTFIIFEDKMFFDGDSSVLMQQGQMTLELFCNVIAPAGDQLSQINIMAHTAQGDPSRPNNPRTDRMLSAMRAAEVCIFIQGKQVIAPDKLVNISYGQFRPIDSNDTRAGRARNRRVEILMIDQGADVRSLNEYYEEYNSGRNAVTTIITDGQPVSESFTPEAADLPGLSTMMSPVHGESGETEAETGFSTEMMPDTSEAGAMTE